MFVIPCKFRADVKGVSDPGVAIHNAAQSSSGDHSITDSMVFKCVESIRAFHPDEKILVVDSDSDNLTYLEHLEKIPNVIAANAKNKNYLDGAIWYAVDKYPDEEWYCLLQDSITIKHSFGEFINGDESFYCLMWFHENMTGPKELDYINTAFEKHLTDYHSVRSSSIIGCWGPCFVAKKEILLRLKKNNLDKCAPVDKYGSNVAERLWGICLRGEGVDLTKNTIDGNFLAIALPRSEMNSKTKYHNKLWGGRQ